MKIPLLLAILSFILFAFTAKLSSASSTDRDTDIDTYADTNTEVARRNDPVLDVDNNPLSTGTSYYIVAANDVNFLGHGFEQSGNLRGKSCPHYNVVLDNSKGSPLTFTHDGGKKELVQVSSDLNIEFNRSSDCHTPLVWKVDDEDQTTGQWFITTGGVEGNKTARTLFKFVKVDQNIYNIIYCPDSCESCIPKCQNVSYYSHKTAEFLALSDDRRFDIKFQQSA